MIEWNVILNETLKILIPLLVTALISLVVAGARLFWSFASAKFQLIESLYPTVGELLNEAARFAVQAAEQVKIHAEKDPAYLQLITSAGKTLRDEAKQYAVESASQWLEAHSIKGIDLALIAAAVEKAVLEQFGTPAQE